jgi:DNA repair protein SbcC/Rad50
VSQILTASVFEGLPKEADYKTCIQHLKAETQKIKEKQKALNEQESHFKVRAQLKTYAEELEEGKPCPLCGSVHHPELFKTEDINDALAELTAKQQVFEQQLEQIGEFSNRLNFSITSSKRFSEIKKN